ncbi:MAG: hypothetical protein ACNS64_05460 [Candidatus Halalkalibacterium sp. M3_1C_030]
MQKYSFDKGVANEYSSNFGTCSELVSREIFITLKRDVLPMTVGFAAIDKSALGDSAIRQLADGMTLIWY